MASQVETAYSYLLSKGYSRDEAWSQANAIHSTASSSRPQCRPRSSNSRSWDPFEMAGFNDSLPSARSRPRSKLDDFGFSSPTSARPGTGYRYSEENVSGRGYDEYRVREQRPGYTRYESRTETRDGGVGFQYEFTSTTYSTSDRHRDYVDDGYESGDAYPRHKVREERPKMPGRAYKTYSTFERDDADFDDYPRGGAPKSAHARPSTRRARTEASARYDEAYAEDRRGQARGSGKYRSTREAYPDENTGSGNHRTRETYAEDGYGSGKYRTRPAHPDPKESYGSSADRDFRDNYRTREARPEAKHGPSSYFDGSKSSRPKYSREQNNSYRPRTPPPQSPRFTYAEDEPINNGVKPPVDLYVVLGMSRSATADELKAAYRKLSLKNHPDRVKGGEAARKAATDKMAEINRAYDVLKDEKQRGWYDQTGRVHETS